MYHFCLESMICGGLMATIDILAGNIPTGAQEYTARATIGSLSVRSVEIATEEKVKKAGGNISHALIDGGRYGNIRVMRGIFYGPNPQDVVFIVTFYDGKKALAKAHQKVFMQIQADIAKNPVLHKKTTKKLSVGQVFIVFLLLLVISFFVTYQYLPMAAAITATVVLSLIGAILVCIAIAA